MLDSSLLEQPVSFQLFGADPEIMVDAAEIMASYKPQMIDINMGCPVKKVTKRGAGAALMSTPELAEEILKKIIQRVSIPVTVKFRAGVDNNKKNGVEFAKMAEGTGVAAITVHGRTWKQQFTGDSDQDIIRQVKKAVSVPVIGNGDILSYQNGLEMMKWTGCDGVMIGRGALGNPWVFKENGRPTSVQSIMAGALRHLVLIEQYLPSEKNLGYVKNHISRYFKGLPGSSVMRKNIFATTSIKEMKSLLESNSC